MIRPLHYIVFFSILFQGCVGFYEPTDYNYDQKEAENKEERIQDSIENYLRFKMPSGFNYQPYDFGDVFVIKDPEIKKLDQLIETKNYLPLKAEQTGENIDAQMAEIEKKIEAQKTYLKENNIYPTYEVNHIYAMEHITSDSALINELDVELYPNYRVKDLHLKMSVMLNGARYKVFKSFINQDPVYDSGDWSWDSEKNSDFYTAAFAALENETDYKDKLLVTILDMSDYIKSHRSFDDNDFAKTQALRWEKEFLTEDYKTLRIDKLENTIDTMDQQPLLVGYSLLHEVYLEKPDSTHKFVFSFDLNYVITKVIEER